MLIIRKTLPATAAEIPKIPVGTSFSPVAGSWTEETGVGVIIAIGLGVRVITGVAEGVADALAVGVDEGEGSGVGVGVGTGVAVGKVAASAALIVKVAEIVRNIPSASLPVIVIVCCPGDRGVVG